MKVFEDQLRTLEVGQEAEDFRIDDHSRGEGGREEGGGGGRGERGGGGGRGGGGEKRSIGFQRFSDISRLLEDSLNALSTGGSCCPKRDLAEIQG